MNVGIQEGVLKQTRTGVVRRCNGSPVRVCFSTPSWLFVWIIGPYIFPCLVSWKRYGKIEKESHVHMMVLEMFTASALSDNGMRFVLLALLLVAVVLLLAGASIAVLTWRSQRKQQRHLEKELT